MRKLLLTLFAFALFQMTYAQNARVQIIHNSADMAAAEVDIYVDGTLALDNFAFRTATGFIDLPAGVAIDIDVAPGDSTDVGDSIATFTYTLMDGSTYIIVADGIVSPTGYDPATPFNLEVYDMGREAATSGSNTDLLVHHGATDAPTVDIVEVGAGAGTIVNDLAYAGFDGYLELPTANYALEVRDQTGTVTVAAYEAPLADLALDGQAVVAVASGFLDPSMNSDGPAFGVWVALASGGPMVELPSSTARVQVVHNSADAAAAEVDVYLGDALAIDNFAFRTATPFLDFPAGTEITISVAPGNSTDVGDAIASFPLTLTRNETYVVVADGIVSPTGYDPAIPFNLEIYGMGRETATSGSNTDLLVHHGATDAPIVDIVEVGAGAGTIVDDLAYSDFAGYLELPTDNYALEVRDETGTVTVAAYEAPLADLALDGQAIVAIASGFLDPTMNSDGPAFGVWVALAAGGPLVELPSSTARVQVVHNSADAAAAEVDVYLGDALAIDNFAFRTATPFLDFPAGVGITISVAPGNSTDVGDAIATFPLTLTRNETYVVVADGIVSPTGYDPAPAFGLEILAGARETSMEPTQVDVQIHHGATDAPTVDIYETGIGIGLIANNIDYTEFRNSYLQLPSLNYSIEVRDDSGTVTVAAYELPIADLGLAGNAVTAVASGFLDPTNNSDGAPFGLWVALPSGGPLLELPTSTARIQVIHNSADAAAAEVDVYIDGALAVDNFAFRTATPFIDLNAGVTTEIAIAPGDSADVGDAIATFPVALAANETYVVVADGIVSPTGYDPAPPFGLEIYDMGREAATDGANTDLLVHHGSTDAPTVDIVEVGVGAGTIVDDIAYTEFAGYLELPTANYELDVMDETGTTRVASYAAPLADLSLDGAAIVAVASGFLDPTQNSDGAPFGIWVALPAGGDLIPLPVIEKARVQVIHNSADLAAAEVDVYIDDVLAIDNFAFRTASPFIDFDAEVEVEIAIAPSTSTSSGDAIATFPVTLAANGSYVVVADGIVSPTGYDPAPAFGLEIYDMGREAATDGANTDVLVHHGSTDAPTVDIVEVGLGAGTIVDDLAYTDFQGYLELPTDDYSIEVRDESGTVTVAAYEAPLSSLGLDGAAIVAVASGFLDPSVNSDGAPFGIWVALPSGGELIPLPVSTARVQVIHNSADLAAAEVDIYINGGLAVDNFAFRTATPFIDLNAGVGIEIAVAPSTSTDVGDAIATFPLTLAANSTYIVVADGIVSASGYDPAPPFGLEIYDMGREAATDGANTDVLVHHGSTDAPTVDVVENGVTGGVTLVDNLSYTEFAGYLELATDDYVLQIRDESGTVGVAAYGAPLSTLSLDGAAITVVASGFLDPSVNSDGPAFGLWVALADGGDLIPLPTDVLDVDEVALENVVVYPNPSTDIINIKGLQGSYEVSVVDMQGRILSTSQMTADIQEIDINALSQGIYQLIISQNNKVVGSKRFIKN
ncbi:MAG: DUF4397 domain-containing protein [Flavobacteriaceae bacterium]|nr:DUF4397 domain-containing protein [Flavobacteriaceae bacterium]